MKRHGRNNRNNFTPLCKFGPGGDYSRDWTPDGDGAFESENAIGKLLKMIAEIAAVTVNPETTAELPIRDDLKTSYKITALEKTKNETEHDNAKTAGSAKRDRRVRGQAMLFGDDSRDRRRAKRKPNNRIRAYRRPSRKKAADQLEGQGTLFKDYPAGSTAA